MPRWGLFLSPWAGPCWVCASCRGWRVPTGAPAPTRTSAPLLLIHSDADPSVPYAQARLLQQRYASVGAAAELLTVSRGPYDPWNYTRWFPDLMTQSAAFLKSRLDPHRRQASPPVR